MLYIQLPPGVQSVEEDEEGYHYYNFNGECHFLHLIAEQVVEKKYTVAGEDGTEHTLQVVKDHCPSNDHFYAEYLPAKGQPSQWCKVSTGKAKEEINHQRASRAVPLTSTNSFHHFAAKRQEEIREAQAKLREARQNKGSKSY